MRAFNSALIKELLPTFERPAKQISTLAPVSPGYCFGKSATFLTLFSNSDRPQNVSLSRCLRLRMSTSRSPLRWRDFVRPILSVCWMRFKTFFSTGACFRRARNDRFFSIDQAMVRACVRACAALRCLVLCMSTPLLRRATKMANSRLFSVPQIKHSLGVPGYTQRDTDILQLGWWSRHVHGLNEHGHARRRTRM